MKPVARAVAAIFVLGLAVACGGGEASDSSTTTPLPADGTPVSTTAPDPFEPSPAGQYLLDGASADVEEAATYSYTIIQTFPTGNTAETTLTLDPEQIDLGSMDASSLDGSDLRSFKLTHEAIADGVEWSYEYAVPADSFPPDSFVLTSGSGQPGWLKRVAGGLLEPRHAYAAGGDGVQVVVTGEIKEFAKEGLSHLEELAGKKLTGKPSSSPITEAADSVMNVAEALDASAEYQKMKQKLAELRECAENPTSPLTKKMYQEDPASKQRILDDVTQVEVETKMDMAVRFIGALNSQASGLATAKWLGFVVGPATSWVDGEIARLSKERIADLEKEITPCEGHPSFAGTYRSPYGNHSGLAVGGIACTEDPKGKWAVISFGNPSFAVTAATLGAMVNDPSYRSFVRLASPGEPAELTGESSLRGVFEIDIGPPQVVHLTVTNPFRDNAVVDTPQFELFMTDIVPDICDRNS